MMTALTDERAAAYGRPSGRQTGGFAAVGADPARTSNGAEPISLSDYASGAQASGTGEQYGTSQQYGTAQLYGTGQLNGTELDRKSVV